MSELRNSHYSNKMICPICNVDFSGDLSHEHVLGKYEIVYVAKEHKTLIYIKISDDTSYIEGMSLGLKYTTTSYWKELFRLDGFVVLDEARIEKLSLLK